MKIEWGCDRPTQHAVWQSIEEDLYFVCPIRCITEHVLAWYEEYAYFKEFNSSPGSFGSMPVKWLEAMSVYRSALSEYEEANRPKVTDKLSSLKTTARGRKRG